MIIPMLPYRVILFTTLLTLSLTAQSAYECVGKEDCQQRWWRAMSWLQDNAKFKVKLKENYLGAKAKTPAHKNRLEYVVEKKPSEKDSWIITAQASCRVSTGCPSAAKKLHQFFAYIAAPLDAQELISNMQNQEGDDNLSPIAQHVKAAGCGDKSQVHDLRTSWSGRLFEVECVQGTALPESLVVRCRAEQCRSLR